jgi:diguanylate cyclase (GGDEF)-like protein
MANIDPLTELFNRRRFMEQAHIEVSKAKRYGRNISVLMIDIDNFKNINDRYGHLAGDKVLVTIAKECKSRLRNSDVIGRYGGEEFVVLLIETDLQKAYLVAESIRQRIF